MPRVQTAHFGIVEYESGTEIEFSAGLPAFETEHSFIALQPPGYEPLLFLQSLTTPQLAFLAIAVQNITLAYDLELSEEDAALLGGSSPESDFEILALVAVSAQGQVTANLQAPIVIHRHRRRAIQAVQNHAAYSCRHPLGMDAGNASDGGVSSKAPEETPCS